MELSELKALSKTQLHDLFIKVNQHYVEATAGPIRDYGHHPDFLKIERQLMEVMAELKRRRRS